MIRFLRETLEAVNAPVDIVRGTVFGYPVYEVHVGSSRMRIAVTDVIEQTFQVSEDFLNDDLNIEYGESATVTGVSGLRHLIENFAERADQA